MKRIIAAVHISLLPLIATRNNGAYEVMGIERLLPGAPST
jgi:hypothetical protein